MLPNLRLGMRCNAQARGTWMLITSCSLTLRTGEGQTEISQAFGRSNVVPQVIDVSSHERVPIVPVVSSVTVEGNLGGNNTPWLKSHSVFMREWL